MPTAGAPAPTAGERGATRAPVLAAMWCCSVGTTWTVELRELSPGTTLGPLADWISSGIPTSQPKPDETVARDLLADRKLYLYPNSTAGPCTPTRHSIGYVSSDADAITQAHRIHDEATAAGGQP